MSNWTRRQFLGTGSKAAIGAAGLGLLPNGLVSGSPAHAAAVDKIRFAYQPGFGYGLFYVAQAKGWLEEAGVALDPMTIFTNGPIQVDALVNDNFDAAVLGFVPILTRAAAGLPVRIIGVVVNSARTYAIVGNEDIDGVPGLRGRTIGINRGSNYDYFLSKSLEKYGIEPGEVELVNFADPVKSQSAFLGGQVDAIVPITTNRDAILEQRTDAKVVFSAAEFTDEPNPSSSPFAIFDLLASTDEAIDQHGDGLSKVMQVFHTKVRDYVTSPSTADQAAQDLFEWQTDVVKAEVTKEQILTSMQAFDYYTPEQAKEIVAGGHLQSFLEGISEFLVANELLDNAPDIAKIINTGPVNAMQ